MFKVLVSAGVALLLLISGAQAQDLQPKAQPAPGAAKTAAEKAPQPDPLDELQVELNKARRAESSEAARKATRTLLDSPPLLKGLKPEAQIEFRKSLESADLILATAGAGAVPEAAKAHFDAAQAQVDSARLERAAELKALKDKVEKGGMIVLGILAALILLPILIMLLVACPEILLILFLIALVIFCVV